MTLLNKHFYLQDTVTVARELLGAVLCKKDGDNILKSTICETEAYTQDDPACHAYKGKTPRCDVMFKEGGFCYVYFIYGMHYCMNVVTEQKNRGCAVLIRSIEPLNWIADTSGPSKLCRALGITKDFNGIDLRSIKSPLWIEKGVSPAEIVSAPRIGISSAIDYPWRFYIKNCKWVSKK